MSVPYEEMLRRAQMASDAMAFNARGTQKTRAQLEQMNAGPRAMQDFWLRQIQSRQNYTGARQLQSDRGANVMGAEGMRQQGMTRRSRLSAGMNEYGGMRQFAPGTGPIGAAPQGGAGYSAYAQPTPWVDHEGMGY